MDDPEQRAAQVAHVLHGIRLAGDDEHGCLDCNTVLCAVCNYGERCAACCAGTQYDNDYYDPPVETHDTSQLYWRDWKRR